MSKTRARPLAAIACGLTFGAAGLICLLYFVVVPVVDWQGAQSWQPVPAAVLDAAIVRHRAGASSTTFMATAAYQYQFEGRTYMGSRVSLSGGSDNFFDEFQRRRAEELKEALQSGQAITVFVDPADPTQAVYNRDLRVGLILALAVFSLIFIAIGAGVILASIQSMR